MRKTTWLLCALLCLACGTSDKTTDAGTEVVPPADAATDDALPTDVTGELPPVEDLSVPDGIPTDLQGTEGLPDGGTEVVPETVEEDIVIDVNPGPEFDRFCSDQDWEASQAPAKVGEVTGAYMGIYNEFPALTLETMKVVPKHPFYVTKIRVALAGTGKARIRFMHNFGRSYPASYEKPTTPEANLMEPIDVKVEDADPEEWIELDVADRGIFLRPTEHYVLVYQHFDTAPYLAVAELNGPEDFTRGLILIPGQFEPYGLGDANYRMELEGYEFCAWEDEERWFGEELDAPYTSGGYNRASVGDLNGDGHDDFVSFKEGPVAFLGDGTGAFELADPPLFPENLQSNNVVLGDLDNDGDLDGFASTWVNPDGEFPNRILLNDGTGTFEVLPDAGVESFEPTGAAAIGDGNNDGILDIYWGNWLVTYPEAPAYQDRYVVGHGDGTFTDMTAELGLEKEEAQPCYGVSWTDVNNDGWAEIWVGNYQFKDNFLFWNLGDGAFEDRADEKGLMKDGEGFWGGHTYGGDWGDFDNDGDLDLFEPNLSHPRTMPYSDDSRLMVNQGPPDYKFVDKAKEMGFIYDEGDVNAAWGDYDNDGDLDLVLSTLYTGHYSKFYRNDGDKFTDITYETGTAVHDAVGAVWVDADEDGDLDLLLMDRFGAQRLQLFRNRVGQDHNWVELLLEGETVNRSAIGARVVLEAGGHKMTRLVKGGGRHMNAQDSAWVHFGLGDAETIDSLTIYWPGGDAEEITGITPNARHHIVQGTATD
jgi:hypothetical protein